ncbi:Crp/Fnr family transcriptional regulator [Lentimicrobium sp. L6]|uniref:Crp/Fnr family transcriptional regulator n=1 Tax=Lentimicrobium sp. L6 TaxID=2735916 RepID=UPI001555D317|nr:Crp/Fnr family transcriptional regulator [Lentimicrobium sp. L6]NPD86883.1 Crp/Fnr family transcriptional regulator [Lentimicrobium sp. L6]
MHRLRTYIEQIAKVTDEDWSLFSACLFQQNFAKRQLILEAGQVENHISFIEEGMVRVFIPKEDPEKEITFGFSFKYEFISAYDSFLSREPSQYQLEALSKCSVWSISYEDLQKVYRHTKIGNLIGRLTAERLFLIKSNREQSLLNQSAEQRYLNLFNTRPALFESIPLKYIASYIGITPQALSRIRKKSL